jgi:Tol biopolymer transport system component/DNA-binding winged helix-turn-helix (wHTH) protein
VSAPPAPVHQAFDLGDWHVDVGGNRLLRGDDVRPLRHKAMALLVLLARHAGQTVPRETLVLEVWDGNHYVADKAINTAVWAIRQALGDDPESPRYVQTVAKKGYRLVAPVVMRQTQPPPLPMASPPGADEVTNPSSSAAPNTWQTQPASPEREARVPTAAPTGSRPPLAAWLGALLLLSLIAAAATATWQLARKSGPRLTTLPNATPLTQLPGLEYAGRLSPDGRWLAFAWWQGRGGGRLFVRRADVPYDPPRDLSGELGDVEGLAWAPDSRTLAFTTSAPPGGCTLWRVTLDGESPQALAHCAALFTPTVDWSPDGRSIAFSAEADGAGGLFAVAPDGSGLRRLSTAPPLAMPDHQPAWSPDGSRLAFARQDPADGTRDLYEIASGGAAQRITALRLHRLHGLAWAADGRDLVYSTTQQDRRVLMRWDRSAGIAVPLGLEGSAPARSTDGSLVYALMRSHISVGHLAPGGATPERLITSIGSDREPHDSPRAPGPVVVSRRANAPELWLAPRDGSPARALTQLGGVVGAPAWSPSGERIAFLGSCGPAGRYGVCRLDLASGHVQPLATDAADYGRPAWHPDGRSIWVSSDRGGRWQVWKLDANTGQAEPITTAQPPGRQVEWAADGTQWFVESPDRSALQAYRADGTAGPALALAPNATVMDWRLSAAGLLVLTRAGRERVERVNLSTGQRQTWADLPLGTLPERARLAVAADGGVLIELANTATADLMQAR